MPFKPLFQMFLTTTNGKEKISCCNLIETYNHGIFSGLVVMYSKIKKKKVFLILVSFYQIKTLRFGKILLQFLYFTHVIFNSMSLGSVQKMNTTCPRPQDTLMDRVSLSIHTIPHRIESNGPQTRGEQRKGRQNCPADRQSGSPKLHETVWCKGQNRKLRIKSQIYHIRQDTLERFNFLIHIK